MEKPANATPLPDVEQLQTEIELLRAELALSKQREAVAREEASSERETHHQLELVLQGTADGITVQNNKLEIIYANKAAAELMGFSSVEELLATPIPLIMEKFEVLDENGGPFPLEQFPSRRVLAGEKNVQEFIRFKIKATGQERWSLLHSTPLYSPENQLYAIINFFQDVTSLKKVEGSLRVQREQFEVTLASIGDAVIATDTAGRVSFMNGVASDLTGWNPQSALGQPLEEVFKIINEYSRQSVQNPVTKVLKEGIVMGLANHTLLIALDGREIPIDDSAAPIRLGDGEIQGVVLVFRDVTERKKAEEREHFLSQASQLLASSLDFETTLQNVAGLAVPLLADWCTVHIVDETEGRESGSEKGPPQQVALAHKDPDKVEWVKRLQKELEERYPYDPKAPTGLAKVLRTGQAELYPDIPDEFLVALAADDYLLQLLRDFGFSSAMIVPLISRGRVLGAIQFTSTRESKRHYNQADLAFARDLADRAALAVDNARLYREAQTAIERLEELGQLKDRFISIASHELRTPLTSLKGYTQLLARQPIFKVDPDQGEVKSQVLALVDGGFSPQRVQPMLRNIILQTDRMNKLIAEMTDISRLQTGRLELKTVPDLNLIEFVRRVVDQQQVAHPDRSIELVRVPEEAESFTGNYDESRLEQVLHNLINNALKYSPVDKPVLVGIESAFTGPETKEEELSLTLQHISQNEISLKDTSGEINEAKRMGLVWVKDEGIGIPEEEQPFIFESYFRARAGREQIADGMGLGLFISQQIVNLHGGQMGVKSLIGKGSTFYFCLPLKSN